MSHAKKSTVATLSPAEERTRCCLIDGSMRSPRRLRFYQKDADRHSYLADMQKSTALSPNQYADRANSAGDIGVLAKRRATTPSAVFRCKLSGRDSHIQDVHLSREPGSGGMVDWRNQKGRAQHLSFISKANSGRDSHIQDVMGTDLVRAEAARIKKEKELLEKGEKRAAAPDASAAEQRNKYHSLASSRNDIGVLAKKRSTTPSAVFKSKITVGSAHLLPLRSDVPVTYRELQQQQLTPSQQHKKH